MLSYIDLSALNTYVTSLLLPAIIRFGRFNGMSEISICEKNMESVHTLCRK